MLQARTFGASPSWVARRDATAAQPAPALAFPRRHPLAALPAAAGGLLAVGLGWTFLLGAVAAPLARLLP